MQGNASRDFFKHVRFANLDPSRADSVALFQAHGLFSHRRTLELNETVASPLALDLFNHDALNFEVPKELPYLVLLNVKG